MSISKRKNAPRERNNSAYVGVKQDLDALDECIYPTTYFFMGSYTQFCGGPCFFPIYVSRAALILVDLPFSFAVDTVLLPTDKIFGIGRILGEQPNKATLIVTDENGTPVPGVYVHAICQLSSEGLTDTKGSFVVRYFDGVLSARLKKPGFYDSKGVLWFPQGANSAGRKRDSRSVITFPTNALPVKMRRIVDPVPMFNYYLTAAFPQTNKVFGFDLQVGDWVKPYGRGTTVDMKMSATINQSDNNKDIVEVSVSFVNPNAGFSQHVENTCRDPAMAGVVLRDTDHLYSRDISHWMASDLRTPYVAPEGGYTASLKILGGTDEKGLQRPDLNDITAWIFRVRTETNEVGEITSANVGWINGKMRVGLTKKGAPALSFDYYYNPDPHSRSLEPKALAVQQAKWFAETIRDLDDAKKRK